MDSDVDDDISSISKAQALLLAPYGIILSKHFQRFYLYAALLLATGLTLLLFSLTAYILFYVSYIPSQFVKLPLHLQFPPISLLSPTYLPLSSDPALPLEAPPSTVTSTPHAILHLFSPLVPNQRYDISVVLDFPRSPPNHAAGNFMVAVTLLDDAVQEVTPRQARAGCLTWWSDSAERLRRWIRMPVYLFGWDREAERVRLLVMEGWKWQPGSSADGDGKMGGGLLMKREVEKTSVENSMPVSLKVELLSREPMVVYGGWVEIRARLSGLRYLMYYHRIFSLIVLTGAFWLVSFTMTITCFILLSIGHRSRDDHQILHDNVSPINRKYGLSSSAKTKMKHEADENNLEDDEDNLSDIPHVFPTLSRQIPLRWTPPVRVKKEEESDEESKDYLTSQRRQRNDEEEDYWRSSDVGRTSHDHSSPRECGFNNARSQRIIGRGLVDDEEKDEDADFVDTSIVPPIRSDSGLGTSLESSVEFRSGFGSASGSRRRKKSGRK